MKYATARRRLPRWLVAYVYHFETNIENAVKDFAATLPPKARLLDAGAGEGQHRSFFARQRYTGVDLAVGDSGWDYGSLDAIADLNALPFADGQFDAAINIVTLEHLREPQRAVAELGRALAAGGQLLIVAPQDWEMHQEPYDYFRYTRHGLDWLLNQAGLRAERIAPVGGLFRVLARRCLGALAYFPFPLRWLAALVLVPLGMLLPLFDFLDRDHKCTLGYVCIARKP
jgi:SAM-dependent methyltransferase